MAESPRLRRNAPRWFSISLMRGRSDFIWSEMMEAVAARYRISLEGIVQGVGFRPFVRKLADRFGLPGIAFNTAGGLLVEIDAHAEEEARRFVDAIAAEAPR